MKEKTAADLLMAIGEDMSAEEMMLLSLQGMIAAEVEEAHGTRDEPETVCTVYGRHTGDRLQMGIR